MGELGALFNPGMRHELEERRSKAMRREEEGNARDGDLRIDLESGVAVINVPGGDADQGDADAVNPVDPADSGGPDGTAEAQASAPMADRDRDPDTDTDTDNERADDRLSSSDTSASPTSDSSTAATEATAPAQPRPRGKRGLAASSR